MLEHGLKWFLGLIAFTIGYVLISHWYNNHKKY